MHQTPATTQVISRSYLSGLVIKCGLLFAGGLILTGLILYFTSHQPLGPSYQESFSRLSQFKEELLTKSIIIYCLLTTMILVGVIFITMIYSHRVVGPLVGIKRVVKAIASGDLSQKARLRKKDAIKPMAEALNTLIDIYTSKITLADQHTKTLQDLLDRPGDPPQAAEIIEQVKAIKDITSSLRLQ
ncbi:MAG: methyl-accepting chemotaxis protein [Desulfobulbaceae bacterium]|nr:methyl-accepting chemotaxis protein [Desulfobulbaceae bacterium]